MEYNKHFFHLNKCIIRTPIISLKYLLNKSDIDSISDKLLIIKSIKNLLSIPDLKNALIVSYSDFYTELKKNINKEDISYEKILQYYITLYKFFIRSSYRSTPYGVFSGVIFSKIGNNSDLILDKENFSFDIQPSIYEYYKFINNLDFKFLYEENIIFFVNTSLYKLRDKYYYIEKDFTISNRSCLINLSNNIILTILINECRKGATIANLLSKIQVKYSIYSREEILSYIQQVISSQVIISELLINPHEDDFCVSILNKLSKFSNKSSEIKNYSKNIEEILKLKKDNNLKEFISNNEKYESLKLTFDSRITNKELQISSNLIDKLSQQCFELFTKMNNINAPLLDEFINKFFDRYEHSQISLLEALDPNSGIGYAESTIGNSEFQPLREGFMLDNINSKIVSNDKGSLEELTDKIFFKYLKEDINIIDIELDVDLIPLSNSKRPLNESGYIFGRILKNQDQNDFQFLPNQIFSSQASKLLKRFSNLGKDIEDLINEINDKEQEINEDKALAEVVNVPNHNFANIILTKNQRKYEIPYYSCGSKNVKNVLLDDLYIKIIDGKVRLISKKLNKEIIPVISHTYNTYLDDPIYKFLSDVASQFSGRGNFWNWGKYESWHHLPRITFKNIILSRESWFIKKEKINYLDVEEVNLYIDTIVKNRKLPQYVTLTLRLGADNELFLNLKDPICKLILAKEINSNNVFLLEEIFKDNRFIKDKNNDYYNSEIIIPYIHKLPKFNTTYSFIKNREKRTFLPGEEWLYIKIYAGSKEVENILTNIILPLTKKLKKEGIIDSWFYIKYQDPDYHLRLRFHKSPTSTDENWNSILSRISKLMKKKYLNDFNYKIIIDTYIREIERYGYINYQFSEKFFHIDSICISSFLNDIHGNEGEIYRYKFAFLNIDNLLNQFKYSLEDKRDLLNKISKSFYDEFKIYFNNEKSYSSFLNNKYREKKKEIEEVLNENSLINKDLNIYFNERNKLINKDFNNYSTQINNLISSYIHMTLNRLFLIRPRENELITYYLLNKFYESQLARHIYK